MTRIIVMSDTHMTDRGARRLPDALVAQLPTADAIFHAGDIVEPKLLIDLETYAPVYAVLGNNDRSLSGALPDSVEFSIGGVWVAMIHNSGRSDGRAERMHEQFPRAQLVVFGHSHEPMDELGVDGQRLFNPGSPTERRRQPERTYGLLELDDGVIRAHEIVALGA